MGSWCKTELVTPNLEGFCKGLTIGMKLTRNYRKQRKKTTLEVGHGKEMPNSLRNWNK